MDNKDKNKDNLTNETLGDKFKSQFDLVNYAIRLADNFIKSGRPPRIIKMEIQNPAAMILEEIRQGKDQFENIFEEVKINNYFEERKEPEGHSHKSEKKKPRRFA